MSQVNETFLVEAAHGGQRLDAVIAAQLPEFSRSKLQSWIKSGCVTVDQKVIKLTRYKVAESMQISLVATPESVTQWQANPIDLDIVYEDAAIIVVNKPADCVVHPAAGHSQGTLINGLLHHYKALETLPRCGLVHRLDKDTTGLMVVAKTLQAHQFLVKQIQSHLVTRHYKALVRGDLLTAATIDRPMCRDRKHRLKMAVDQQGKPAITHYRIAKRLRPFTLLDVFLETGRTHQIRVHLNDIGHPIVADPVYGRSRQLPKGLSAQQLMAIKHFGRQALHAFCLQLQHPVTGEMMQWEQSMPQDFEDLLAILSSAVPHG